MALKNKEKKVKVLQKRQNIKNKFMYTKHIKKEEKTGKTESKEQCSSLECDKCAQTPKVNMHNIREK